MYVGDDDYVGSTTCADVGVYDGAGAYDVVCVECVVSVAV